LAPTTHPDDRNHEFFGKQYGYPMVMTEKRHDEQEKREHAEDEPGEPGAEGGSGSEATDKLPASPANDDSAVGDTDQHSSA
jgi:hypothetical protein